MKLFHFLPLLASIVVAAQSDPITTYGGTIAYDGGSPPYNMTVKFGQDFLQQMQDLVYRVENDMGLNWTHVATEMTFWRNRAKHNARKWQKELAAEGSAGSGSSTPAISPTSNAVSTPPGTTGTSTVISTPPAANGAPGTSTTPAAAMTTSTPATTPPAPISTPTGTPGTTNTALTTAIPVSYSPPALTPISNLPFPGTTTSGGTTTTTSSTSTASLASTTPTTSPATTSTATSTSSAPTSTSTPGTYDTADQSLFLSLHNTFRAQYGAAPVVWNNTLAEYAYNAASTCKYGHTGGPYGENIAAGVGGGYDVTMGFGTWSDEYKLYNWSQPGYSEATGHFTQIVWKGTTQIGCAASTCADGTIFTGYGAASTYLVCEYAEPGNWVDPSSAANTAYYFTQNVGTAVSQ